MQASQIALALSLAALSCLAAAPSHAAGPAPAEVAPGAAADASIVVSGPGRSVSLTAAALAALPSVQVPVPGGRTFEGPLLWTVLAHAGAIDPTKHQGDVRGAVLLAGQDGYTAILALGELSPEFEGKQVILALRMDGQPLELGHLRVVVPGDKRGGRGVHDLVQVRVEQAFLPPQHTVR